MDVQSRPENENDVTPMRIRLYYALIDWVARNRKWLPVWAKMALLKMVRRKKGIEYMQLLVDAADKANLRKEGRLL